MRDARRRVILPRVRVGWWAARARGGTPGRITPGFLRAFELIAAPVVRVAFRPTIEGVERLRRDQPALIVANHSGGFALAEIFSLVTLYLAHLRGVRIAALGHPFAYHLWPMPYIMRALGTVPATYEAARQALEEGASVLVFPGGDYEVSRPFWQADRVDFNGRKGFLKIARTANVPIVPLGIRNSHWSVPILWRSTFVLPWVLVLPKLFGLKRYPLSLLSVVGAIVLLAIIPDAYGWPWAIAATWSWMSCPVTLIPIVPVTVRFFVGREIPVYELSGDEDLDASYRRVVGEIQSLVRP